MWRPKTILMTIAFLALSAATVAAQPVSDGATPLPPPATAHQADEAAPAPATAPTVEAVPAAATAPVKAKPKAAASDDEDRLKRKKGYKRPWYEEVYPQPKVTRVPFKSGEHLLFKLKVLGKDAGTAEARVRRRTRKVGKKVYEIEAKIRSAGMFDSLYPVEDDITTYLDPRTSTPVRANFVLDENKDRREVELTFGGRYMGRARGKRIIKGRKHRVFHRAPLRMHDPLSAFYHMRARKLREGEKFTLFVDNGVRVYRVEVDVAGKEDVWTELGMQKGWKLKATVRRANGTKPKWKQKMSIWFSTDKQRLPLKMSFEMKIGSVEAVLAGVQNEKERKKSKKRKKRKKRK